MLVFRRVRCTIFDQLPLKNTTLFALQVILTQLPGQELHVEMFDKDMDMKDDFMGRYKYLLIA